MSDDKEHPLPPTREELIARAHSEQAVPALRALTAEATDEELARWNDREMWAAVSERLIGRGLSKLTIRQYLAQVRAALGIGRRRKPARKQTKRTDGDAPNGNTPRTGVYCDRCCGIPWRRPRYRQCQCGEMYAEEVWR